jgi:hypothetical protein
VADTADKARSNVNAAKDAAQPYVDSANQTKNRALATGQNYGDQTASSANQTYGQASAATRSTADDLASRGQDLKQSAGEGVNAYLKLGQDKANELSNKYS